MQICANVIRKLEVEGTNDLKMMLKMYLKETG